MKGTPRQYCRDILIGDLQSIYKLLQSLLIVQKIICSCDLFLGKIQTAWHTFSTFDRKVKVFAPPLVAAEQTIILCYSGSVIVLEV